MSLVKPVVYDGQLQRQIQQGDTLLGTEVMPVVDTTGLVLLM